MQAPLSKEAMSLLVSKRKRRAEARRSRLELPAARYLQGSDLWVPRRTHSLSFMVRT